MKKLLINDLEKQNNKKLIYYLENYSPSKALLIFDHGLGDLVEFMHIFKQLEKDYPKWDLYIGHHDTLDYEPLYKKIYKIKENNKNFVVPFGKSIVQFNYPIERKYNIDILHKKFNFIFNIVYKDYCHPNIPEKDRINATKIDMCKITEIGYLEEKKLTQFIPDFANNINNKDSKRILVHIGGHTDKSNKNPSPEDCKKIWHEIIDAGYEPFDIHSNHLSKLIDTNIKLPDYISEDQTIRNKKDFNLNDLFELIKTSKYLVGVASGPLLLANVSLGSENCLALEGNIILKNYIQFDQPATVPIFPYREGSVYEWLKYKEQNS